MMSSPVSFSSLAAILATRQKYFMPETLESLPDYVSIRAYFAQDLSAPPLQSAFCNCGACHREEIFYHNGDPFLFCPYSGSIQKVDPQKLHPFVFRIDRFLHDLAEAFFCHGPAVTVIPDILWCIGISSKCLAGIPRRVFVSLSAVKNADLIFNALPQQGRSAILVCEAKPLAHPASFDEDRILPLNDIFSFTESSSAPGFSPGQTLEILKDSEEDLRRKNAKNHVVRAQLVERMTKELKKQLFSAYSFYCNSRNRGISRHWQRISMTALAELTGTTKGTVSKILADGKTNSPRYPELVTLWKILDCEQDILLYGRNHCSRR